MSNQLAGVTPNKQLFACATLEPSGRHLLKLDMEGLPYEIFFCNDQIEWLKMAISEFQAECNLEDMSPIDRMHRINKPLMRGIKVGQK